MLVSLLPVALPAQVTTGALSGYVLDPAGRAIPHAAVRLRDPLHAVERQAETDAAGLYRFVQLPASVYRLRAEAPQFTPGEVDEVILTVGESRRQDLSLSIAGQGQTVTIADRLRVASESASLGLTLEESRIRQLPLNRRDFLSLALLAPGVNTPTQNSELSTRGSVAMHASGGREEFNQYLLDGVDNNDPYNGRYVMQPLVESIQEFRVETSTYSAEFGRSAGGQVNVITRSGTNDWHGEAFEYFRNRSLDAANFFETGGKARLQRNQFGGALGGPVRRNRTFFYANAGSLIERRGLSRLGTVPTLAERQGIFATPVMDPFTQQPFPNNTVPATRLSPLASKVLDLYPLPNRAGVQNFAAQPIQQETYPQGSGRVDHILTPKDTLSLRYSYGRQDLREPFAEESQGIPGFGDIVGNRGHNVMAHHTRILSPTLLHSFRAGFSRSFREVLAENHQTDVGRLWGVSWLNLRPRDFGYPQIQVAGLSAVGDSAPFPIVRTTNTYQLNESLQWVHGAHVLKGGADVRRLEANGYLDYYARGQLSFTGALSGNGVADLLLGLPTVSIQSTFDNPQTMRTFFTGLWLQDDWKATRRLTVNLGLRYEYFSPVTDRFNQLISFNPVTRTLGPGGSKADRNNFAPRVGLAFLAAPRTVLRAGYGVYFDAGMFVLNSSQYFNPPNFNIGVWFPSESSLPTLANPFPTGAGYTPPPSLNSLSPYVATPYLQQWSAGVDHQLGGATTISAAYVGSKGSKLIRSYDFNQPAPGPGDLSERRPLPQYDGIFFTETGGNSSYHSLQLHLNRRFSRGLSVLASYTLGHSIDEISAFIGNESDRNFPQNSRSFAAERASSSFDVRQRFVTAFSWVAPWKVELRSIISAQTGQPFNPLVRSDNSNTGNVGGTFGNDRPNLLHTPRLDNPGPEQWFDTSAFAVAPPYTFGNAGRNILRGPGLATVDFAVSRRFALGERVGLAATVEAYNLFNRTNFDMPQRFVGEPAFGTIGSAKAPRQLQLGLRFQF